MANKNLILVDPTHRDSLKPFTWARPLSSIRIGILSISEKWEQHLHANVSYSVPQHLQIKYSAQISDDNYIIQSHILPTLSLINHIHSLNIGEFITSDNDWIAGRLNQNQTIEFLESKNYFSFHKKEIQQVIKLQNLWEIFQWNEDEIKADFNLITHGKTSATIDNSNQVRGNNLFIEEGASISNSIINTLTGPVYIGKHATIMEGCMIRGPFALCDHAQLKMGAKIYGATTIGPDSRIGGEVNNSVIQGYSNKAHDGFLGNSVIGEWCNIGADSNNSNLKNNYDEVKLWNYESKRFIPTGSIFCGLMMGDHAKCGINTMFNTGTVVGYGANIFGDGFPRQYIPEFAWGGASGFTTFQLDKFYQTANEVMKRRNKSFDESDQHIAKYIFEESAASRSWDKTN